MTISPPRRRRGWPGTRTNDITTITRKRTASASKSPIRHSTEFEDPLLIDGDADKQKDLRARQLRQVHPKKNCSMPPCRTSCCQVTGSIAPVSDQTRLVRQAARFGRTKLASNAAFGLQLASLNSCLRRIAGRFDPCPTWVVFSATYRLIRLMSAFAPILLKVESLTSLQIYQNTNDIRLTRTTAADRFRMAPLSLRRMTRSPASASETAPTALKKLGQGDTRLFQQNRANS